MNIYANLSDKALLEIMDDYGVAHEVIHEAASRLSAALDEREALVKALKDIIEEYPNPRLPYGMAVVRIARATLALAEGGGMTMNTKDALERIYAMAVDLPTFTRAAFDAHATLQRACNAHDALVEACEAFAQWQRPTARDWDNGAIRDEFNALQQQACAALALAKGEA